MADCKKCLHKNVCWFMHGWRDGKDRGTVFHCGFYEEEYSTELLASLKTLQKHCDERTCSQCVFCQPGAVIDTTTCKLNADSPAYWDTIIHEMEEKKDGN